MKNFNIENFYEKLFELSDAQNQKFGANLLPNIDEKLILGIKFPKLRTFTKKFFADVNIYEFLDALPHKYFEENIIHTFLVSDMKDYSECLAAVKKFLPYIDNWSVCDVFAPIIFKKHTDELEPEILQWLDSDEEYIVRFGLLMLMKYYPFAEKYLDLVAKIRCDKYYAQMMAGLYFTMALAKNYDAAVVYLEEKRLPKWIHRKTLQKVKESRLISEERKNYLRGLKF